MTAVAVERDTIGTYDEAQAVLEIGKMDDESLTSSGWEALGSGVYRQAFRAPSGTVYKVPHWFDDSGEYDDYGWTANEAEHRNARRFRNRSWCPPVKLYEVDGNPVIAMPFIDDGCAWHTRYKALSDEGRSLRLDADCSIGDMHDSNYRVINGSPIVIDLAGSRF